MGVSNFQALCVVLLAWSCSGDEPAGAVKAHGARFVLAPRAPTQPQSPDRALSTAWLELAGSDPARELPVQFSLESRPTRLLQPGWTMSATARSPGDGGKLALEYGVLEKRDGASAAALE